jgi:hypothetical protein
VNHHGQEQKIAEQNKTQPLTKAVFVFKTLYALGGTRKPGRKNQLGKTDPETLRFFNLETQSPLFDIFK